MAAIQGPLPAFAATGVLLCGFLLHSLLTAVRPALRPLNMQLLHTDVVHNHGKFDATMPLPPIATALWEPIKPVLIFCEPEQAPSEPRGGVLQLAHRPAESNDLSEAPCLPASTSNGGGNSAVRAVGIGCIESSCRACVWSHVVGSFHFQGRF